MAKKELLHILCESVPTSWVGWMAKGCLTHSGWLCTFQRLTSGDRRRYGSRGFVLALTVPSLWTRWDPGVRATLGYWYLMIWLRFHSRTCPPLRWAWSRWARRIPRRDEWPHHCIPNQWWTSRSLSFCSYNKESTTRVHSFIQNSGKWKILLFIPGYGFQFKDSLILDRLWMLQSNGMAITAALYKMEKVQAPLKYFWL